MGVRGQIVDTSRSGGMNIGQYWARLFLENELYYADPELTPMDNGDIVAAMLLAFPGRGGLRNVARHSHLVNHVRAKYNRGALPGMTRTPKFQSYRYVLQGDGTYKRTTSRGRLLPESEQGPHSLSDEEFEQEIRDLLRNDRPDGLQ